MRDTVSGYIDATEGSHIGASPESLPRGGRITTAGLLALTVFGGGTIGGILL